MESTPSENESVARDAAGDVRRALNDLGYVKSDIFSSIDIIVCKFPYQPSSLFTS